jgi:hypothetical protein
MRNIVDLHKTAALKGFPKLAYSFGNSSYNDILVIRVGNESALDDLKQTKEIKRIVDLSYEMLYLLEVSGPRNTTEKLVRKFVRMDVRVKEMYLNVREVK